MQYFKPFKIFEADVPNPPEEKKEDVKTDTTKSTTDKPAAAEAPSYRAEVVFKNTFNYNKVEVNDSFEKTMTDAIAKLDEFMKNENKDNVVEVVQINATGSASWVPTTYKSNKYDIKNNQTLALDRAKSIADEVRKRIEKYFKDKGITDIQYKNSEIKGNVDYKGSQETFAKFIKEKYNAKTLIEELKKKGAATIKLIKDVSKVQDASQYLNVNQYAEKNPDNVKTVTVDDAHGQEIYDDMQKSPLYVLYTARLGSDKGKNESIETAYRDSTQYAKVEIVVNDPSELKEEKPPAPTDAGIKSITFDKDVDKVDANGTAAIKLLTDYLSKLDVNTVKSFILIGHSEADDELNKITFNPNNESHLKDKAGKETIMSEKQLADLRFILSIARCKTVYRAIQNIENVKKLIAKKAFWMLPAGTIFGEKLVSSGSTAEKQRIVQVVVLTDKQEINTEASAVPYGTDFKSPVLTQINNNIKLLGYSFSKLVPQLLGANTFGVEVPAHLDLAKDENALAHFHNQYA